MPIAIPELRKILKQPNALAVLRARVYPEPAPEPCRPQLALWVVDDEGLPPRPWLICGDTRFDCRALGCKNLPARICVARQAASDAQRTRDTWRGQGFDYPLCVSERCAQGRAIRAALDPTHAVRWRGAGPNGRFDRGRSDAVEQYEARQRLAAVGLLDEVPTVDAEPAAVESEGDGEISAETATERPGATVQEGRDGQPEGTARVGPRDARGVRAQVPAGSQEGRHPHDERGGREGPARGGGGDPRPSRGQAVLTRASQGRGDRR